MRTLESGNFGSAGELEHKLMTSAAFFKQVLVSPLHDAAARGNLAALRELIENSKNPLQTFQKTDNARNTTLHWAGGAGHLEIIMYLVTTAQEFEILESFLHAKNMLGDTVLHRAVWRGHKDVVEYLLNVGIDREISNSMGQKAIDLVRENISIGCLLQNGRCISGIVSTSSDDDDHITNSDDDSFILNLSDTSYSDEDEDVGVLLVENRMKDLFSPLEQPKIADEQEEADDDVPELIDE